MREILFRGQTRRHGEKVKNFAGDPMPSNWVYGGVCCGKGAFSIIYAFMDEEKEIPIEKHVVYTDTIGQYTGLTDENGKKIFEGDIVKATIRRCYGSNPQIREETKIIAYDNLGILGLKDVENVWSDFMNELSLSGCIEDFYFEVIGNIHDNPELLKGE